MTNKMVALSAMTEKGYEQLVTELRKGGIHVEEVPNIHVGVNMIVAADQILQKKIRVNPYEKIFEKTRPHEDTEHIRRLNALFQEIMPVDQ